MDVRCRPIGFVRAGRSQPVDDDWGSERATIELCAPYDARSLEGLAAFSHVEVLFFLHGVPEASIVAGVRQPRGNPAWAKVGIFAQRAKSRPNRLGSTICRILSVEGARLHVVGLDAIEGTPVLDLKPVMREFLPREEVRQPGWSHELMRGYWGSDPS